MSDQGKANYTAVAARIGGQFDHYDKLTPSIRAAYDAGADAAIVAGGASKRLADGNTRLREENNRLRGQLQAVKQLAEQAVASGIIDSRALLDQLGDQ